MKQQLLIHKNFSYKDCPVTLMALQAQIPTKLNFIAIDRSVRALIKENNSHLYYSKENTILCVWFEMFEPIHEVFANLLLDNGFCRNDLLNLKYNNKQELIIALFKEYIAWLTYIKDSALLKMKKLDIKDVIQFILIYNNKLFLLRKTNKFAKQKNIDLNLFISYWLNSFVLREVLELLHDTLFLPNIHEIAKLKDITSI